MSSESEAERLHLEGLDEATERERWEEHHAMTAVHIATFDPPTVAALIDRVERAERERDEWRGRCICNTGPNIDGPDETCPVHGREYGYWVEEVVSAQQRELATRSELAALRAAVEGLADEWEAEQPIGIDGRRWGWQYVDRLRGLLTEGADDGQ